MSSSGSSVNTNVSAPQGPANPPTVCRGRELPMGGQNIDKIMDFIEGNQLDEAKHAKKAAKKARQKQKKVLVDVCFILFFFFFLYFFFLWINVMVYKSMFILLNYVLYFLSKMEGKCGRLYWCYAYIGLIYYLYVQYLFNNTIKITKKRHITD